MPKDFEKLSKMLGKMREITGYDPNAPVGPDAPLRLLKGLGRGFESLGAAPTRAALRALQEGHSPLAAFKAQFGENPDKAPTAKDLVEGDPITAPYADTLLTPTVGLAADVSNIALPGLAKLLGKAPKAAKAVTAGEVTEDNVKAAAHVAGLADPREAKFQLDLNPEVYKYKHGLLPDEKQRSIFEETKRLASRPDIMPNLGDTVQARSADTVMLDTPTAIIEPKKAAAAIAAPVGAALAEEEDQKLQGIRKLLNK